MLDDPRVGILQERIDYNSKLLISQEEIIAKGSDPPNLRALRKNIEADKEELVKVKRSMLPTVQARLVADSRKAQEGKISQYRDELETLTIQQQTLETKFRSKLANIKDLSGETLELEFARSELVRAENVVDLISNRIVELRTEKGRPKQVTVFTPAKAPSSPIEAIPLKQMLLFGVLSLGLPFGLAFLWEIRVRRVNDAMQLEQSSNLAVIGQIASLPASRSRDEGGHDLLLFEESIDSLRTGLTLSEPLKDMQVLTVTSAASQEGKTSVASQLAVSIARSTGEKTLLIDGDMRSPDIHNVFDVELEPRTVGSARTGNEMAGSHC